MQIQGFHMHKLEFLLSFIILMALKDTNIYHQTILFSLKCLI